MCSGRSFPCQPESLLIHFPAEEAVPAASATVRVEKKKTAEQSGH